VTDCEFLAYVAGFVDGEGCISLTLKRNKDYFTVHVKIIIANTNFAIIKLLKEKFGGYIGHQKGVANKRTVYNLQLSYNRAIVFLEKIYPYLIIKRKQAELAFEFYKLIQQGKKLGFKSESWKKLGKEKLQLKEKMHQLNSWGSV